MQMQLLKLKKSVLQVGLLLAVICFGLGAEAATTKEEYAVKAALVYNFARFSQWPEEAFKYEQAPLRVVVYGDKSLDLAFSAIEGTMVGEHPIEVIHVEKPEDLPHCHLLFLAKTERDDWPKIMAILGERAVLTVGEMNGFIDSGGVLNLHLDKSKINFEVNLDQAKSNNIIISSRILKLASSVINTSEGRE